VVADEDGARRIVCGYPSGPNPRGQPPPLGSDAHLSRGRGVARIQFFERRYAHRRSVPTVMGPSGPIFGPIMAMHAAVRWPHTLASLGLTRWRVVASHAGESWLTRWRVGKTLIAPRFIRT
jgi:hypothetical protein